MSLTDRVRARLTFLVGAIALVVLGLSPVAQARTVVLAWDRNPEPQAVGYRVYVGVETGEYSQELDAGPDTLLAVEGLEDDTTYYFAVVAYDAAGSEGPASTELISPGASAQVLGRPKESQLSLDPSLPIASRASGRSTPRTTARCCLADPLVSVPGRIKDIAAESTGRIYYIDGHGQIVSLEPGTKTPHVMSAQPPSLGGLAIASGISTHILTFEPSGVGPSDTLTADLVRYRVSNGVLIDRAVLVPDITSARHAELSKIATDPLGRVYAALAGSSAPYSRADAWAGQILRYDADGRVPTGNTSLSPEFSEGFDLPLSLSYSAGHIGSNGLLDGKPRWRVASLSDVQGSVPTSQPTCAPLIDPVNSGIIVLDTGSATQERLVLPDHYQATDVAADTSRTNAFVVAQWNALNDATLLVRYECVR